MRAIATARVPGGAAAVDLGDAAAADEGELARLGHHLADGGAEAAGLDPVEDHFGDRELALERLAARFEIDGAGEAIELLVAGVGAGMLRDQIGEGDALPHHGRLGEAAGGAVGTAAVEADGGADALGRDDLVAVLDRSGGERSVGIGVSGGFGRRSRIRRRDRLVRRSGADLRRGGGMNAGETLASAGVAGAID